jgi:hypothetical protein
MKRPTERLDGRGRIFGERSGGHFDLESSVMIPGQGGPKRDFIADPTLDPRTAIDPDRAKGRLVGHPDMNFILRLERLEKFERALPDKFEILGDDNSRAKAMLQGIDTRFGFTLVGFGASREQGIPPIRLDPSLRNDHENLEVKK